MLVLSSLACILEVLSSTNQTRKSECSQAAYYLLTEFCLPTKGNVKLATASAKVAQAPLIAVYWGDEAHAAITSLQLVLKTVRESRGLPPSTTDSISWHRLYQALT